MMNKHGLPVLPAPAKQRRSEPVCRFNLQGNKLWHSSPFKPFGQNRGSMNWM